MGSDEEKWKEYAHKLAPHKYEIGAGILLAIGLFYLLWIGYMVYKAIMVRRGSKSWMMQREISAEFSKYTLTTIGLCFQYMVIASYIVGKIVKNILIDTRVLNVSTCDSEKKFLFQARDVLPYYYVETIFQVFAMLAASCMLTTFNRLLKYMKYIYGDEKNKPTTQYILMGLMQVVIEIVLILFISIIGVGIPIALVILFVCILYKFVRFVMNCKAGYKLYRTRLRTISEGNDPPQEEKTKRYEELETECVQFGYIATVFCFGAGFYVAQLGLDPLTSLVEASCTIFPEDRENIVILFHFMNLLVWGSFALVVILFLPFFIPYTLYYIGLVCFPRPVLNFLSSASNCFRKPPHKIPNELSQPLIPSNSKVQT